MDDSILSQLKSKPKPATLKDNQIKIKLGKKEEPIKDEKVQLNVKIENKLDEKKINRKEILEKIQKDVQQQEKPIIQEKSIILEKAIEQEKAIEEEKSTQEEKPKITIIKKSKKLVLDSKEEDKEVKPNKPRTTKKPETSEKKIEIYEPVLDFKDIKDILPNEPEKIIIKSPAYYQNNREIFINFINSLFEPYKKQIRENIESYSCSSKSDTNFELLFHQKIVRDYLNLYTPYRGLLLYHGLGSGKTCSSIGIAEAFKTDRQIVVMTPASLQTNYIEELKKCGDMLYRKTQSWKIVKIEDNISNKELITNLTESLNLQIKTRKGSLIKEIGGI